MNWQMLTPILEQAQKKTEHIDDTTERIAMLVFYVAEMVESEERKSCANLCNKLADDMTIYAKWGANTCATQIRARGHV
jgi:hypothetical protein